jgi:guanylate kinase
MKVVIIGPGASGKDHARKLLLGRFTPSVSYTTRPMRPGEQEGRDYHYVSAERFGELIGEGFFYEWNFFAGAWYYGTPKESFENGATLFIMTPSGVAALSEKHRSESVVVYINPPLAVRSERLLGRKDADNAERRLSTDAADFDGFSDFDVEITDPAFTEADLDAALAAGEAKKSGADAYVQVPK